LDVFSIKIMSRSKSTIKRGPVRILATDHTGITVSNLERALAFWRDVLGFELSHTAHQTGEMAREITGVAGAEIKLAVVKAPGGHKIELLEYLAPPERKRHVDLRPCDVGSAHVAVIAEDLDAILSAINVVWLESRWQTANASVRAERRETRRLRS
jgi:catechol 2,3-dioxygenase-like lactoylglutathione lyase family enzyme